MILFISTQATYIECAKHYFMYKKCIKLCVCVCVCIRFPDASDGKEFACNARDLDSIPGLGGSLGEGHGNSLQLNSMDRGA